MSNRGWLPAPVGIDSERWITRTGCRHALVVVHTVAAFHRLLDVVDLIESDPRVQVTFTVAPDAFNHSVSRHLRDLGALVLPWDQAIKERFDLVLAAAHGGLHELHGPLMVMAHGAGRGKLTCASTVGGPALATRPVFGLDAPRLTRDGRVIASAILLSHDAESDILRLQCPEAVPAATVTGDPCYDRLVASIPQRQRYRRALGVTDRQRLLVVSSTWGPDSLFGRAHDLIPQVVAQLSPRRFRIGAVLHPAIWSAHGTRQVRAWLRGCRDAGLLLIDPAQDWRAVIVAADCVVGDHGSVTAYAAAVGCAVLRLTDADVSRIAPGSAQAIVMASAGRLDPDQPVEHQIRSARPVEHPGIVSAITSRPGQAAGLIRNALYRMARLDEPAQWQPPSPVPVPHLLRSEARG